MGKVEKLEQAIQSLSRRELAQFRAWYQEFDWTSWDAKLEADVRAGKLDSLANRALREHAAQRFASAEF